MATSKVRVIYTLLKPPMYAEILEEVEQWKVSLQKRSSTSELAILNLCTSCTALLTCTILLNPQG